jgi:hypothetical protein
MYGVKIISSFSKAVYDVRDCVQYCLELNLYL